jgi:predicted transcriptional regulator
MDEISDSEKKAIESGIADANDGKLNSHSEAKKIYGKWL